MRKIVLMGESSDVQAIRNLLFTNLELLPNKILVDDLYSLPLVNVIFNEFEVVTHENSEGSKPPFTDVEAVVYVMDIESRTVQKDLNELSLRLFEQIIRQSPTAKIYCLLHKMDLVPEDQREMIFRSRKEAVEKKLIPNKCVCFPTSIWDETLYKAWSTILRSILPNVSKVDACVAHIADLLDADEVVFFHQITYMALADSIRKPRSDTNRFEKISNIMKQFQLSCRLSNGIQDLEIRNSCFATFICKFVDDIIVMVVSSNSKLQLSAVKRALQLSLELMVPLTDSVASKINVEQQNTETEQSIRQASSKAKDDVIDSSLSAMAKEIEEIEIRIKKTKNLLEIQMETKQQHSNASKMQSMEQILDKQDTCIWNQVMEIKRLNQQCKKSLQLQKQLQQSNAELEHSLEIAKQKAAEMEAQWVVDKDEITIKEQKIGQGAWGVVKVANFRGIKVAAKTIHLEIISDYYRSLFVREMNIAARLRHPNIVQFIGATIRGDMIILTELLETSLRGVLERNSYMPQSTIYQISVDLCRALNYLHLMRPEPILHRDVSSSNVLLQKFRLNSTIAKLADFGTANIQRQLGTVMPGNSNYAAPEAIDPSQQSPKMDVFSFGVLLIEMCTGKFPEVNARNQLIAQIKDRWLVKLLRKCIVYSKEKRPDMTEILSELSARKITETEIEGFRSS